MRPTKNKGSLMGGKKREHAENCICKGCVKPARLGSLTRRWNNSPLKKRPKTGPFKSRFTPMRFRSKTSKRGREASILPLVVALVVKEYEAEYGDGFCEGKEPDHVFSRHGGDFKLGAMLDPLNLQMLSPAQHAWKTDNRKHTENYDFRSLKIMERLTALTDKILVVLGPVWNLKDLRKVLRELNK